MSKHLIRLRGGWESVDLDSPNSVPQRITLPVPAGWNLARRLRLTRRFGCPRLDPSTESVWLQLGARPHGSASPYALMTPLQLLKPTPYAITAQNAQNLLGKLPVSQIDGLPVIILTNTQGGLTLAGAFTGDGSGLTNVPLAGVIGKTLTVTNSRGSTKSQRATMHFC